MEALHERERRWVPQALRERDEKRIESKGFRCALVLGGVALVLGTARVGLQGMHCGRVGVGLEEGLGAMGGVHRRETSACGHQPASPAAAWGVRTAEEHEGAGR